MHLRFALSLVNSQEIPCGLRRTARRRASSVSNTVPNRMAARCALEAFTDHMCMLEQSFLPKITGGIYSLTRTERNLRWDTRKSVRLQIPLRPFYGNGATSADTTLDCLLLNDAVCVPCHEGASPVGKTIMGRRELLKKFGEVLLRRAFLPAPAGFPALKTYPKLIWEEMQQRLCMERKNCDLCVGVG